MEQHVVFYFIFFSYLRDGNILRYSLSGHASDINLNKARIEVENKFNY